MARMTAEQVATKWSTNAGNAEKSYKDGVAAVSVSPTELAAQAKDKWIEGLRKAAETGSYEDGLRKVSLADWKRKVETVGAARFRQGVTDAKPKMAAFLQQWLPEAERISEAISAMPDVTEAQRDQRMLAAVQMARQFRYTKRGS